MQNDIFSCIFSLTYKGNLTLSKAMILHKKPPDPFCGSLLEFVIFLAGYFTPVSVQTHSASS